MALEIDILQSFVIARPGVEIDRGMRPLMEIVAKIADRSHLRPIATNRTTQKLYDPVDCGFISPRRRLSITSRFYLLPSMCRHRHRHRYRHRHHDILSNLNLSTSLSRRRILCSNCSQNSPFLLIQLHPLALSMDSLSSLQTSNYIGPANFRSCFSTVFSRFTMHFGLGSSAIGMDVSLPIRFGDIPHVLSLPRLIQLHRSVDTCFL